MVLPKPVPRLATSASRVSVAVDQKSIEYIYIVGLDVSLTDTGMVLLAWNGSTWDVQKKISTKYLEKVKDPVRQFRILGLLQRILYGLNDVPRTQIAVVIEDYAFGKSSGKVFTRAELRGMLLKTLLVDFGVCTYLVSPTALKRFMGASGDGKKRKSGDIKDAMARAASIKFKFISTNDNIVDAYCLTRYLIANKEGQRLTLVKHLAMPQYAELQVPANS